MVIIYFIKIQICMKYRFCCCYSKVYNLVYKSIWFFYHNVVINGVYGTICRYKWSIWYELKTLIIIISYCMNKHGITNSLTKPFSVTRFRGGGEWLPPLWTKTWTPDTSNWYQSIVMGVLFPLFTNIQRVTWKWRQKHVRTSR